MINKASILVFYAQSTSTDISERERERDRIWRKQDIVDFQIRLIRSLILQLQFAVIRQNTTQIEGQGGGFLLGGLSQPLGG